ncbi:glutamate-5-semialdehyde dehydrogenase [Alkalibaculum sp. M08DMB]|uniref:Gamma-glutamyl phosphate reductase n=1 Tax=Alkalibaculum sporogenes TaxID=2655001 RepID=A0A6A7KBC6_9FIRM|nr:glutamate-5-semialdehyde dehydrogenase [Alkalibaculum sporogenes]MPW26655.1 glutamate-5-semialdehyde dehydrogenase [Alkalibaculum sporogenes]
MSIIEAAKAAKKASIDLAAIDTVIKDRALAEIVNELENRMQDIVTANNEDMTRSKNENLPSPLLKRLKFDEHKVVDVIAGIESLRKLPEPVGKTLDATALDTDLELYKVSCPIGVIGVIFESRPDALVQISSLCLKSGNAVILKGGTEARSTNRILWEIIKTASEKAGIPSGWIQLIETREDVTAMLKLDDSIDLIVPRGSNEFVKYIMENSNIPVLGHADGICHCYIDEGADIEMAVNIALDSKTQYVAVCNATETLLVNKNLAESYLPLLKKAMDKKSVELVGDERVRSIIDIGIATDEDWKSEYLDYKLSIKIVDNIKEAITHINTFGSGHTEVIVSNNKENVETFMNLIDSGNVFWNCSTRFSDGFRYGFGAEVGISTNKIHARGPVGLEGLLIYKYKMIGHGNIVDDYETQKKTYKHVKLKKEFKL